MSIDGLVTELQYHYGDYILLIYPHFPLESDPGNNQNHRNLSWIFSCFLGVELTKNHTQL